nr:MAG TPA: hypothetical protein [Caudoviricetes sp.]
MYTDRKLPVIHYLANVLDAMQILAHTTCTVKHVVIS